ncbi:MAG: Mut7-C ubiquitin/RNAse domain-containing protein [Acidobacteria bacterium]|nr:Mut7-C ubiquitin/RNAse domain-containing protein [Acidobacteriota bacterium]
MNRATFRFYAELNDFLPHERRARDIRYEFLVPGPVKDAIESLGVPHTEVELVLVNGESSDFARLLADGDRVSVYPVFEALDVGPLVRVRPAPLRQTRFILDGHLGRLARYLRMLGFDSAWERDPADEDLARRSVAERRILLTRDRGLLKRREVTHGCWVRETDPRRQLKEIVARFDLAGSLCPFTRCLRCNAPLRSAAKAEVESQLPPRTRECYHEFLRCTGCGGVYWSGPHHRRMQALVDEVGAGAGG